jgi:hypothetical protein
VRVYACVYVCIHALVYMFVYTHMFVYIYIHTHMYTCIYIYIYIHICLMFHCFRRKQTYWTKATPDLQDGLLYSEHEQIQILRSVHTYMKTCIYICIDVQCSYKRVKKCLHLYINMCIYVYSHCWVAISTWTLMW